MHGSGSTKRVYRNETYPILGGALILFLWIGTFAVVVGDRQLPVWSIPMLALGACAVSWAVYRFYVRSRVESDARGITIVNPFKTVFLSWDEVDRCYAGTTLMVVLRGGPTISAWAVQAANGARMLGRRSFADDVASDLNQLMLAAQGNERSADDPGFHMSAPQRRGLQVQAIVFAVMMMLLLAARLLAMP